MGGAAEHEGEEELVVELALTLLGGCGGVHELHNDVGSPRWQEGVEEDGAKAAVAKGRREGLGGAAKEGVGEAVWGLGVIADGKRDGGGSVLMVEGVVEEEEEEEGARVAVAVAVVAGRGVRWWSFSNNLRFHLVAFTSLFSHILTSFHHTCWMQLKNRCMLHHQVHLR